MATDCLSLCLIYELVFIEQFMVGRVKKVYGII